MMLLMLTIQAGCSLLHLKKPGRLRDGHVGYYHSYWPSLKSIVVWFWQTYTSSLHAPNKTSGRDWQRNSSTTSISTKRKHQGQENQQDTTFQSTDWYLFQSIGPSRKQLLWHVKLPIFSLFAMAVANDELGHTAPVLQEEQSVAPVLQITFVKLECDLRRQLDLAYRHCLFFGIFSRNSY